MVERTNEDVIYDKNVIEFVTVGVEFCAMLESDEPMSRDVWIDKMVKILPLLYLKASLLPLTFILDNDMHETFVKEKDYVRVQHKVSSIMADEDIYLDVFVEEMKYSERPISSLVSENIADIYQDVRNFISVYQYELTEQMRDAIYVCKSNFEAYWGQKLVNVMRPLHALRYDKDSEYDNDDNDLDFETWD